MSAKLAKFTSREFRTTLGKFPTGVTVITAQDPITKQPLGLTISSFGSVSLEPPMVLWSLTHTALSLQAFLSVDRYVIHVLSASQKELARKFAIGGQQERFANINLELTSNGTLKIADNKFSAWFECYNSQQHIAGDHTIFVGQVEHCQHQNLDPLIYHAGDFALTPWATNNNIY